MCSDVLLQKKHYYLLILYEKKQKKKKKKQKISQKKKKKTKKAKTGFGHPFTQDIILDLYVVLGISNSINRMKLK